MNIINQKIKNYINQNCSNAAKQLHNIERKTYLEQLYPQMVSGKVQGQFLKMISRMIQPKHILEIGTFTAYGTICLAAALAKGGSIDTIEIDEELKDHIELNFEQANISTFTNLHIGNALEIIPTLNKPYDLIFLDADKATYPQYFNMLAPKMKAGSFLLADNVLWDGKVVEPTIERDKATQGVIAFNRLVKDDPTFENVILSVRDGLMLAYKI